MYNPRLDTFMTVAKAGSFVKAAEVLHISSPAVIQQINLLEEKCGVRLFVRSHRGVTLTPAGHALNEDGKRIIDLCNATLDHMHELADTVRSTIRIGTSVLFKCRLLPDICQKITEKYPGIRFELPPSTGELTKGNNFSDLGVQYDVFEGLYCTIGWKGLCSFIELSRSPICCAVSRGHRFAGKERLRMEDLDGETLVMPARFFSAELDAFRAEIIECCPHTHIVDSPYFGLDTFTMCEMNLYVLITQPVYRDTHTNLKIVPLETDYTIPYGIMYPLKPGVAVMKFIRAVDEVRGEAGIPELLV